MQLKAAIPVSGDLVEHLRYRMQHDDGSDALTKHADRSRPGTHSQPRYAPKHSKVTSSMRAFTLSIASLCLSGVSLASDSRSVEEIRKQDALWVKAAATKNPDAWIAFYAPDATVLPPNEPVLTTKAQIRESIAKFLALPNLKVTWKPTKIEISRSGELGYAFGAYQLSYTNSSGDTVFDRGKNVEIWKKQPNGSWKCLVDTWNSSLSADPLLSEWTGRYEAYLKTITSVDFAAWQKYLADDFVWIKADGTTVDRQSMINELAPLFKAKTIKGSEKILGVVRRGDDFEVSYSEDWVLTFPDRSVVKIQQGGADVWRKIAGKWQIVKSLENPASRPK